MRHWAPVRVQPLAQAPLPAQAPPLAEAPLLEEGRTLETGRTGRNRVSGRVRTKLRAPALRQGLPLQQHTGCVRASALRSGWRDDQAIGNIDRGADQGTGKTGASHSTA